MSQLIDNLISYYKLDENTGTSVGDSIGSNTGTFNGSGTKWTPGKINTGGIFNGSDNNINMPGFNNAINYAAFSIQLWVQWVDGLHDYRFLANSHTDSDNKGFQLYVNNSGTTILFMVGNGTTNTNSQKSSGLSFNTWYHLIGTFDSSNVILYVNGIPQPSSALSGAIAAQTTDLAIGNNPNYNGDFLNGKADELGVWNRILTPTEALQLYNNGAGLSYPFNIYNKPENALRNVKVGNGMSRSEGAT